MDSQSAMPENLNGWRTGITGIEMSWSIMYKLIPLGPTAEMSQISKKWVRRQKWPFQLITG